MPVGGERWLLAGDNRAALRGRLRRLRPIGLALAAAACLDKSFGLARGRALMLPLGYVCVAVTSFIVKSVFEMLRFYQWDVWGVYGTLVQVGVIAVLAAGYLVHSVRKGTRRGRS